MWTPRVSELSGKGRGVYILQVNNCEAVQGCGLQGVSELHGRGGGAYTVQLGNCDDSFQGCGIQGVSELPGKGGGVYTVQLNNCDTGTVQGCGLEESKGSVSCILVSVMTSVAEVIFCLVIFNYFLMSF